jgi:hypothetical protein
MPRAVSRRGRRRHRRSQNGGAKTFKANRPPADVKFKLLNVQSIATKFSHPALRRSNTSWAAIKATAQYATLKRDAEKLFAGEDLEEIYALYMLVGDTIVCSVTFIPNVQHKYKKSQISYVAKAVAVGARPNSGSNSNSDSDNSNNDDQPDHISFKEELPQDMAYIDFLSCSKETAAYKAFPNRPASHYLLYQAVKLIERAGTRFINLTVAADVDSPSTLYMFYKRMGFHCFPLDFKEHDAGFPFLFTRLSYAGRVAAIETLKRGGTYLNQQQAKAIKDRNTLETYIVNCNYMIGLTSEILEKLTATVSASWNPPAPNVGPSAPANGPSAP